MLNLKAEILFLQITDPGLMTRYLAFFKFCEEKRVHAG